MSVLRAMRCAAVQPLAGIPPLSPGARRFRISLGFIASARRAQDLPATLLRNSLPSQWRDLTLGIGGMESSAISVFAGTRARSERYAATYARAIRAALNRVSNSARTLRRSM